MRGNFPEFLENVTLASSTDELSEEDDAAVLMTTHSAKGKCLRISGCIYSRNGGENTFRVCVRFQIPESLSEERRLCYVAIMTRAKEKLCVPKNREAVYVWEN